MTTLNPATPAVPATKVARPAVSNWKPAGPSLTSWFNPRVLIFAGIALLLIGFPVYVFLDEAISGGVHDRGSYLEVDLKAMSNFEMDQNSATDSDIPQKWRDLNGKRVALVGELWSGGSAGSSASSVELCYSIAKCCFSGPPKVQHFVKIVPKAKDVQWVDGLVTATGILHVKIEKSEGVIKHVYALDTDSIEAVK